MKYGWQMLLGTLMIVCLMSGCARMPRDHSEKSAKIISTKSAMVRLVEQRQLRFNSVSALTQVKLIKKGKKWSTTQGLLLENPYNLRIDMVNFFGQITVQLSAVGPKLDVYVPTERTHYLGVPTIDNIQRFTGLPLPTTELVALLLAKLPPTVIENAQVFAWEHGLVYMLDSGAQYRVTLAAGQVSEVVYGVGKQIIYRIHYSMFAPDSNYPQQIKLQVPLEDIVVKLHFTDVDVNQQLNVKQFALAIPPGTIERSLNDL